MKHDHCCLKSVHTIITLLFSNSKGSMTTKEKHKQACANKVTYIVVYLQLEYNGVFACTMVLSGSLSLRCPLGIEVFHVFRVII